MPPGGADLRDLLGAYALEAVDAREAEAMRAFVSGDALAAEELAELMAAADALAMSVEPMTPPPGLRGRIAETILAEPAKWPTAPAIVPLPQQAPPVALPPTPIRQETPFWRRPAPWATAAAALLLVTLGLLFWNLQLQNQIASVPTPEVIALATTDAAPFASGEVHSLPQDQLIMVTVRDLPPLPEDHVYEVWLIGDGAPVPAGTFDQSTARHAIVAEPGAFQTLAITIEPGPLGTEAPTSDPIATASL